MLLSFCVPGRILTTSSFFTVSALITVPANSTSSPTFIFQGFNFRFFSFVLSHLPARLGCDGSRCLVGSRSGGAGFLALDMFGKTKINVDFDLFVFLNNLV